MLFATTIFKTLDLHLEINFLSSVDPHQDLNIFHFMMWVTESFVTYDHALITISSDQSYCQAQGPDHV